MTMTISGWGAVVGALGVVVRVRVTGLGHKFFVCHIILIKVWWSRSMAQSTHSRCKIIAIFSDNYRRKLLNMGLEVKFAVIFWENV